MSTVPNPRDVYDPAEARRLYCDLVDAVPLAEVDSGMWAGLIDRLLDAVERQDWQAFRWSVHDAWRWLCGEWAPEGKPRRALVAPNDPRRFRADFANRTIVGRIDADALVEHELDNVAEGRPNRDGVEQQPTMPNGTGAERRGYSHNCGSRLSFLGNVPIIGPYRATVLFAPDPFARCRIPHASPYQATLLPSPDPLRPPGSTHVS
jgi:hypothetical protein